MSDEVAFDTKIRNAQILNLILTLTLISITFLFSYLINFPAIIPIFISVIVFITYYEEKVNLNPPKYSRFVYILSLVIFLGTINFWIIPFFADWYPLNVQIIVFCIIFYLSLQFFIRYEYFKRENVIIAQHILTYFTFIIIAYSFFPILSFEFSNITNESVVITLNILAHVLINLSVLLGSFYYLYARNISIKSSKVFSISILIIFLLIELSFFAITSTLTFYRAAYEDFIQNLIIGLNIISIIFLIYSFVNYMAGIIPKQLEKKSSYVLFWIILILTCFSIFLVFYPSFYFIMIILLLFSVVSQLLFIVGHKFAFISKKSLNIYRLLVLYAIYLEIFILAITFFFDLLQLFNIEQSKLLAIYFSLLIITLIHNISCKIFLISERLLLALNIFSLLFTTFLIGLYSLFITLETYYLCIIPVLFSCLFLFIPLLYIKKFVLSKSIVNKLILINIYIVSMVITAIPYIITLDMIKLGFMVELLSPFNVSLGIFYLILALFYIFSKNMNYKEGNRVIILKIQIGIEFILAFTTVFYYLNLLLKNTAFGLILPLMATTAFLYLPLLFSLKKSYFPKVFNKKTVIFNTFVFWGFIISLPSFVAIQLEILGYIVDLNLIILISGVLVFTFLLFLNHITNYLNIASRSIEIIKIFQLINWIVVCILLSRQIFLFIDGLFHNVLLQGITISISVSFFLLLNIINLPLLESFKQIVFEDRKSRYDYYKIYKIYEYTKNIIYFGMISAISFLISLFPQQLGIYSLVFTEESFVFQLLIQIAIFMLLSVLFMRISSSIFKIEFEKVKLIFEMVCWLSLKIIICVILMVYPIDISFINKIFLVIVIFTLLTPISVYYLNEKFIILEPSIIRMKQIILTLFLISTISFFVELYWLFYFNLALFAIDRIFLLLNSACIIYISLNFTTTHYKHIREEKKSISLYKFFGAIILLLSSLILINSIFFIFFLVLIYSLILYKRNNNIISRLITYLVLSIFSFNELIINFDSFNFLKIYTVNEGGLLLFLGLISTILVLMFSIIINVKAENFIETHLLYILISIFSYVSFLSFTSIAQIYSISISISLLLLLLGSSFYRQRNELFKWFLGIAILILIFNLILFISETFLFVGIIFQTYKPVLSYTLTFSLTGILFISIFYSTSEKLRKLTFRVVLGLLMVVLPTFIYFFLICLFLLPLFDPIVFIISVNVFIFLFYLSIAIYQGKFSWQIWRTGWWLWIICPVANYYIIYESFVGIDLFTNALSFFGLFNIDGSFIISMMICIVISLPFWYSWIKKYFFETLLIVWGISLFAIYWLSQNVFASSLFFTNFLFVVFAVFLLIPILFWMKLWRVFSILWTIFSITVVIFLLILFSELGFLFEMNYSLNIIILGGFFMIASFFPTFQAQRSVIIIISYTSIIIGIFLTMFYINYFIFLNFSIALAISLILMGMSLFSSRIFKLNQSLFNFLISIMLVSGSSLLTYSTFSLIPGFELNAFFLTMSVAGLSFFVFNHYKMLLGIQKIIPLVILSLGLSLSLSSFVLTLLPNAVFLSISTFLSINIVFLCYTLYEKRFITFYLIPLPITMLILEFIRLLEIFQPLLILILIALMVYTSCFQLILNLVNPSDKKAKEVEYKGLLKIYNDQKRIKVINFSALILNSTYFSLFISFISQLSIFYQILEFFIVWSILILISLRYFKKGELDKEFIEISSKVFKFASLIAFLLYFEVAFLIFGVLLEFFILDLQLCLIISLIAYFLLTLVDIYVIKLGYPHLTNLFNIVDYLFLTAFLFMFLTQFLYINSNLLYLLIIVILLMQFYTNHAFFNFLKGFEKFYKSRLDIMKEISKNVISNVIYVNISLYGASFLTNKIQQVYPTVSEISIFASYIMIFSFFMYGFNFVIKSKYRTILTTAFFITFQLSLVIFWLELLTSINILNLFNLTLLIIIETIFSFYSSNLICKLLKERIKESLKSQIYGILSLLFYIEVALLTFSISIYYLDFYRSILISQVVLFFISLFEIENLKRMKKEVMLIIRFLSYLVVSIMILLIFGQIGTINFSLVSLGLGIFTLMQFYSNYLYYKIRKCINTEKELIFVKWKRYREKILGISFYILLILFTTQVLIGLELEVQLILFIDSLIAHIIMIGDNYIFKLTGKHINIFIIISWGLIFGFSFFYFITWIAILSLNIVPVIILLLLFEIAYLYQIAPYKTVKFDKKKIKRFILCLYYSNFISWPLYYLSFDVISTFNLILLSLVIFLFLMLIDKRFKAINDKLRTKLINIIILNIGAIVSLNVFFFLEFYVYPKIFLNLNVSLLLFMLFMGYLIKPFKRKKILSFVYWTLLFVFLSVITYNLTISGFSWGFILFGITLYPFIFMLEEVKLFIENIAMYIKTAFYKIKNGLITLYYGLLNFLNRNFIYIKIIICIGLGTLIGFMFSDFLLGLLNTLHSVLLSLAVFGISYGLIPSKRHGDTDEMFEQKMKRFITIWISTSLFIYVLILPYIESFVYSLVLMTSSILGLGAILLIFIYRKEKRQKISIKWRFYTTIVLILLVIVWIILIIIWYFAEVRI